MKGRDLFRSDALVFARDPQSCKTWYQETFDAREFSARDLGLNPDEQAGCVFLGWGKDEPTISLVPGNQAEDGIATITCPNLKKATEFLASRGVTVFPIQQDRAGTRFFEIRDCEGNTVEFYEET